jgi:rod shape-determining protein MreC
VKKENAKLKAEVNQLRQKALLGEGARAQNARLRQQLNFVDSPLFPNDYSAVNTRIIGWRNEFDERVMIAAGRDNGIHQETPVVTNDGLVGIVTQVTGSAALVTLLTDESSAVQARDQDTGAFGVVRHGEGEGSLIVDRVTKDKLVKEGDVIVTAGRRSQQYPSLFPANIPIGYVISVGQSDTAPFKQIQIQPFVDFSSLDAVTALITNKKNPQAP